VRVSWRVAVAVAVSAGAVLAAGVGPAQAVGPPEPAATATATATSFAVSGQLFGVAAASASRAWAVGYSGNLGTSEKTLIVGWNGKRWARVTSPKPLTGQLDAVSATSASNAWAVGYVYTAHAPGGKDWKTLVMHWNGRAWSRQAGAVVPGQLTAVATAPNGDVWAVGGTAAPGFAGATLILHRTSGRWYVVPVEGNLTVNLDGVAATGTRTAWAVGSALFPNGSVLLRWNGTVWKPVSLPLSAGNDGIFGAAGKGSGAAWAVGESYDNATEISTPIRTRLTGATWRRVPVPAPKNSLLNNVGFVPGGTVWAVGETRLSLAVFLPLILRWSGSAWVRVPSPNVGRDGELSTVAATSAGNAWAVGNVLTSKSEDTLILHWNGKAWS
jgi:hypothetical protein